MQHLWSALLWTELLVLLSVAQLFRPIETIIHLPRLAATLQFVVTVTSWISLLLLPGWRWSRIFFLAREIGGFERGVVSICVSGALVLFSTLYLQIAGIDPSLGVALMVVSFRIFVGCIYTLHLANITGSDR